MSQSSLWGINASFHGEVIEEFSNSWFLTPPTLDVLFAKYMHEKAYYEGRKLSFISASMFDESVQRELNVLINETPIQEDRVLWEFANQ